MRRVVSSVMAPKSSWMKRAGRHRKRGPTPGLVMSIPTAAPAVAVSATRATVFPTRKPANLTPVLPAISVPIIPISRSTRTANTDTIYRTEGHTWNFDGKPDEWQPGEDYRAPTCASCHMSQVGDLEMTHNVSDRLYWVQWSKSSPVRGSDDVMSPILGNGPGRPQEDAPGLRGLPQLGSHRRFLCPGGQGGESLQRGLLQAGADHAQ